MLLLALPFLAAAAKIGYGFKAGMSETFLRAWDHAGQIDKAWTSSSLSLLGVFIKLPLTGRFSLQPELYYAPKGSERKTTAPDPTLVAVEMWRFHYLEVPLLLQYEFNRGSAVNPKIFVGPYASYLLNGASHVNLYDVYTGALVSLGDKVSIPGLKKYDYGLTFGVGAEIEIQRLRLLFDMRYDLGLTSTADSNPEYGRIKTGMFYGMIGVRF